jgi:excisionase family DNA binding protein
MSFMFPCDPLDHIAFGKTCVTIYPVNRIGYRLKMLRLAKRPRVAQWQIAVKMGRPQEYRSHISAIESERFTPSTSLIEEILDALEASWTDLEAVDIGEAGRPEALAITPTQAATRMNISTRDVNALIRGGEIKTVMFGKRARIAVGEITAFLERNKGSRVMTNRRMPLSMARRSASKAM